MFLESGLSDIPVSGPRMPIITMCVLGRLIFLRHLPTNTFRVANIVEFSTRVMLDPATARKLVHIFVTIYVTAAVVYSSFSLLMAAALKVKVWLAPSISTDAKGGESLRDFKHVSISSSLPEETLYWPTMPNAKHDLRNNEVAMREPLFLAKAFSQTMQPCKIIPFYYKGSATFEDDDITITTLVTFNRFRAFGELAKRYRGTIILSWSRRLYVICTGPISAAVHVVPGDSHVVLDALHDLYTSTPGMSSFVDVHLVFSPFARQLNTWRNAARLFARTEFVMMLDVDFAICTDFRSHVRANLDSEFGRRLRDGYAALVVLAFEYVNQQDGIDPHTFPSDKKVHSALTFISAMMHLFQVLLELVKARKIDMFHKSWAPGHNSSDYPRFYAAASGEVYRIKQYQSAYEPYVIFKKEGPPWYVLGFGDCIVAYHAGFYAIGAMSASWDMGEIKLLVCMKCISPECHFLSSRIIS